MKKLIRAFLVIDGVYLIAAFSHADILWFTSTGFIENLTWALAAVWLAAAEHMFMGSKP